MLILLWSFLNFRGARSPCELLIDAIWGTVWHFYFIFLGEGGCALRKVIYWSLSCLSHNKLLIHFFDRTKLAHGMLSGKYSIPAAEVILCSSWVPLWFSCLLDVAFCSSFRLMILLILSYKFNLCGFLLYFYTSFWLFKLVTVRICCLFALCS